MKNFVESPGPRCSQGQEISPGSAGGGGEALCGRAGRSPPLRAEGAPNFPEEEPSPAGLPRGGLPAGA